MSKVKRKRSLNKPKQQATVSGWGINDADYKVTVKVNGKSVMCPFYDKWKAMVKRSHNKTVQEKRPSLKDNSVCIEWKYFMSFKSWMEAQPWKGMDLDKDVLVVGNKHYSPTTCRFVPNYINQLVNTGSSARSLNPIGVLNNNTSSKSKRYSARLQRRDGSLYLGSFFTPLEAHLVWAEQKANYIEDTVAFWAQDPETKHSFSYEIADSLLDRVWRMRLNVVTGQETLLI